MAEEIKQRKQLFTGPAMLVFWLGIVVFTFHACTHMVAAGDTWVAMACGRHHVNHGIDTVEPFSANSHQAGPTAKQLEKFPEWTHGIIRKIHPTGWINQNWGTHVTFFLMAKMFGSGDEYNYNMLVVWKFIVTILGALCIYKLGKVIGAGPALSAAAAMAAVFVARPFIDIRPAVYSNVLVPLTILIFALSTYKNVKYIWLIVPTAVFWGNVHGGYIYIFIMFMPFVGLNFFAALNKKTAILVYNLIAWPFFFFAVYHLNNSADQPGQSAQAAQSGAGAVKGLVLFCAIVLYDLVLIFMKDRLRSVKLKDVIHIAVAAVVAFLAIIIFNPFHLTNITHTFEISLSEHAASWRNVNEWHPAFSWQNPVGHGFPFLIMFIFALLVGAVWLVAYFVRPGKEGVKAQQIEAQCGKKKALYRITAFAVAVLFVYTLMLAVSLVELNFVGFFICSLFAVILLFSVFRSIHFIYLVLPLHIAVMFFSKDMDGFAGRYIYPFVLFLLYAGILSWGRIFNSRVKVTGRNILIAAAVSAGAFLLMMILFNPFELKALWSYEGGILVGFKKLFFLKRQWLPVYEGTNPFNYKFLFPILYLINIVMLLELFLPAYWRLIDGLRDSVKPEIEPGQQDQQEQKTGNEQDKTDIEKYQWPRVDLGIIAVAVLTVYMAIVSRRFIPIAAAAAAPVVALLIRQSLCMISATMNYCSTGKAILPRFPEKWRKLITLKTLVIVAFLGILWGARFKNVYLDPWPNETKRDSVFMRMTASNVKPFEITQFMRLNNISGKMFNYWTEGGALAFGQQPDPETGMIPLKLFMDGRAQAAYNHDKFQLWAYIHAGGPVWQRAMMLGRALTPKDYQSIGQWIDDQMKNFDVWVVVMPYNQSQETFMRSIKTQDNWRTVFLDDYQEMLVDIDTEKGKELYTKAVIDKTAEYPGEFSKNLVLAHNLIRIPNDDVANEGVESAIKALDILPCRISMIQMVYASRHPKFGVRANQAIEKYLEQFERDYEQLKKQGGFSQKAVAAVIGANHLAGINRNDKQKAQYYAALAKKYSQAHKRLTTAAMW